MVLAPEHKLAAELATPEHKEEVEKYIFDSSMKSNVDRLQDKEKTEKSRSPEPQTEGEPE